MDIKSELLRKLIDTIDVGIVFVDADNKLVVVNRAAGDMLNVDPEERMGTSVLLCHPKELEQTVIQRIDDIRDISRTEGRIVNYQGRYIHESFYSIYDEKGKYLGIMGVFKDAEKIVSLLKESGKFEEPRVFGVREKRPREPCDLGSPKS